MTIQPQLFQNMLRTYGHHLDQGRRIARYRKLLQQTTPSQAIPSENVLNLSNLSKDSRRTQRRKQLVEKIAREIMESLMVSESANPVVEEIKKELQREFGFPMEFRHPLLATEIQILRKKGEGLQEITGDEKRAVLEKLWRITLNTVNETML